MLNRNFIIRFFKRFFRNNLTHPINQKLVEHKDVSEVIVYTYIGEKCIHVSEVKITPLSDYPDRLNHIMNRDRKSAKVFRETVFKV